MQYRSFDDLPIWREAHAITIEIYRCANSLPLVRDYALSDQIRRSSISISANIVEGFERNSNNEFIRFLKITKGSIGELRNHLSVAYAVGYISSEVYAGLDARLRYLGRSVGGLVRYLTAKRRSNTSAIRNS